MIFIQENSKKRSATGRETANATSSIYLTVRWQALNFNYKIPKEL